MTSDRDHIQPRLAANCPQFHLVELEAPLSIYKQPWSHFLNEMIWNYNFSGQNSSCQICATYPKFVLFVWFSFGWTASKTAWWTGWVEGY